MTKKDQLKQIQSQIEAYKEKFPNSLGEKGNLKAHIFFLDSYKISAESIINEDIWDEGLRKLIGSKSDPVAKIPGIDI